MTNSEEEVAHEDEPVLGVLTGQVPISGPFGKMSPKRRLDGEMIDDDDGSA